MRAMVLDTARAPLRAAEIPDPEPTPGQALVRVRACGVCRTDLHIVDGELDAPEAPPRPRHQVVGEVVRGGGALRGGHPRGCSLARVDLRRVPILPSQARRTSATGRASRATTWTAATPSSRSQTSVSASRSPTAIADEQAAPLLCAGLIGYRSLRLAGDAERIGLYGFGASAHIVCQVAVAQGRRVFAGTRAGDDETQAFARSLGAVWAGDALAGPPEELDAVIVFAPAGELVPAALRHVRKGGSVVCAGIHMSDIPSFPYELLWGERVVRSVANLTRADGEEFLAIAPRVPVRAEVETFPLEEANEALDRLRRGELRGSAVLVVHPVS